MESLPHKSMLSTPNHLLVHHLFGNGVQANLLYYLSKDFAKDLRIKVSLPLEDRLSSSLQEPFPVAVTFQKLKRETMQ